MNEVKGPASLGLVKDERSGQQCLLDSGSQVLLWPTPSQHQKLGSSSMRLIAANGSAIRSYGTVKREIKIDKKLYTFRFIFAEISRPILGTDFLQCFGMTLDLAKCCLLHSGIATRFSSATRAPTVSGISVLNSFVKTAQHILSDFPEVTDMNKATTSRKHNVQCHI